MTAQDRRFPRFVYRHGSEPDARFTLANERTFLAWIRTALALLAGGIALKAFIAGIHPGLQLAASLTLIATGIFTAAQAWTSWARTERALRENTPLPSPMAALPIAVAVVVVAVLVLAGAALA